MIDGTLMPITGIILSKLLAYLSAPWEVLAVMDPELTGREYLEKQVKFYSLLMGIISFTASFGSFIQKHSFGTLGENVTEKIRQSLYTSILRKHIGWFDDRDNATSVLTSAMAQDTSVINGVSTESLAPQLEGMCAILAGVAIGFYACWQEALVCLAVSPIMTIGNAMGIKFQLGLVDEQNALSKEANLLCGDAIINYRTVQSFGHEELVVKKYEEMLTPGHEKTKSYQFKSGFAFGLSQFT